MSWISDKICEIQNALAAFTSSENTVSTTEVPNDVIHLDELSALKVPELKALAKERGLKGYTGLRKAQLIEMLDQN
jgi:large subunit ribosomal protein L21